MITAVKCPRCGGYPRTRYILCLNKYQTSCVGPGCGVSGEPRNTDFSAIRSYNARARVVRKAIEEAMDDGI
jgi:hypothetical protein